MDTIWSNIKQDSRYQQEEVQDWASHLEHLQPILVEFDTNRPLVKSSPIWFFWEAFKPLIKVQIELCSREYNSWDKLVKKTVAVEAKANLQLSYYSRDIDKHCSRGNHPSHTILSKPQGNYDESSNKTQALQARKRLTQPPSSFLLADSSEPSEKKAQKEKKKKYCQEHKKNSGTLATGVNTDDITSGRAPKDMSLLNCFNCNRTGHYVKNCPKPKRDLSKMSK